MVSYKSVETMSPDLQKEINHYLSKKTIYFKNFSQELLNHLETIYPNHSTQAQWYILKNNIETIPLCAFDGCKKDAKFNERKKHFDLGCCKSHNQKITFKKNYGVDHPLKSKKQQDKLKKSVMKKYGVDSIAKLDSTKQKIKATTQEKYGVTSIAKLQSTKDKITATMMERYGVKYAQQSKEIKAKTNKTNIDKFGVAEPLSDKSFREKGYQTNIDKYGSIFPMKNKELLKKRLETVIERYDSYSPLGHPEINKKFRKTIFEKYYNDKLNKSIIFKPLFTLEEYIGTIDADNRGIEYDWICLVCNHEFKDYVAAGNTPTCNICYPRIYNKSKLETELFNAIDVINKQQNVRGLIGQKEIDIYLESFNIGIEFNGMYWHSEQKGVDRYYHLEKTIISENIGISLIHIFEYEWLHSRNIIMDIINKRIGTNLNYISLNDVTVRRVYKEEKTNFLETNYIAGDNIFTTKSFGLYSEDILVALMSITQDNEINHFVTKIGISFIDGNPFLKLFKSFGSLNNISYYVDRRFAKMEDEMLLNAGFTFEGSTEPSLYYNNKNRLISSTLLSKNTLHNYVKLIDDNLSIKENMISNGYLTIWDCGKLVYKFY